MVVAFEVRRVCFEPFRAKEEELEVLLETRTEKLSECKNRALELIDAIESKDNEIEELSKRVRSLANVSEQSEKIDRAKKEQERILLETQASLEEVESDNTKMSHTLKLKEKKIEDLEKRVTELESTKTERQGPTTIRQKETRITILTQNNKKLEETLFNLESRPIFFHIFISSLYLLYLYLLEESSSQINKLNRILDQKDDRIKSLKNRLEEAVHQNNKLMHGLELKDDKIKAVEERDDRKTVHMLSIADKRIADLNDEIRVYEKQNATLQTQSEGLSSRNAQLQIENESLRNELHIVKGDYASLHCELNEARDYYHQLDLSAVNMGHRCEMLSQLNATLEEENKALHDKVSWLMGQNRELMVKNLEEKDQFMEEERFFSDKFYTLQRTKERLEEQIDLANKALSEAAPPKKVPSVIITVAFFQQKKEDIKDINRPNRNQVQLLRVDYHDDIDTSTVNSDQHDDNVSYLRPIPPGRFDEGSIVSRDSSASGDSGRASKGLFSPNPSHTQSDVVLRRPRSHGVASTSSMMTPREIEEFQGRKVSHDVSAFRARQVRSEIFADNFHTGRLSRPKSLDNLNKIGGFRGSNDTLSSASAVAVDNAPSKNLRRGRRSSPPASPPSSAFRVVPRQNSSPITSKRADVLRSSPTPLKDNSPSNPRRMRVSPQSLAERELNSSQYNDSSIRPRSPSPARSRRSSFSSAVSGQESDHEMDRRDDISVSSKRSSIAERAQPPPYHKGLDISPRPDGREDVPPQERRSSRGPPPPYQRTQASVDEEKRDESFNRSKQSTERRPPPYPEASKSPYGLKRTPSVNSRTGTPRDDPRSARPGNTRETPRDRKTSPRQEQIPWPIQSTPQVPARRTGQHSLSMDTDSHLNRTRDSSFVDNEPEVLIDATESTVSAVPVSVNPSSTQHKVVSPNDDNSNRVIPTFFRPVESLAESPLRRMNSMPRYNLRSRSMEESQGRPRKESSKTTDTLFAAVLVRQRASSDNPRPTEELRRPTDLPLGTSASEPVAQILLSMTLGDRSLTIAAPTLWNKVMPESPRWLIAHNRLDEAHAVLMKYGGKDNKPVDPEMLRVLIENVRRDQLATEEEEKKYSPLDLVRTPKMRKWIIIMCYQWDLGIYPVVIFGVLALIATILMYWIPETLFAPMHQTIDEAEDGKEDFSVPCCGRRPRTSREGMPLHVKVLVVVMKQLLLIAVLSLMSYQTIAKDIARNRNEGDLEKRVRDPTESVLICTYITSQIAPMFVRVLTQEEAKKSAKRAREDPQALEKPTGQLSHILAVKLLQT
ncbi:hypothetical protein QZH41_007311 [Actinostola sp. cb2023]|nr:hypothetical protein QZH41_007311 [Actinostola sp. cb2023]